MGAEKQKKEKVFLFLISTFFFFKKSSKKAIVSTNVHHGVEVSTVVQDGLSVQSSALSLPPSQV
jgi:hypothetical protein